MRSQVPPVQTWRKTLSAALGTGMMLLLLGCSASIPGNPKQSILPGAETPGDLATAGVLVDLSPLEAALSPSQTLSEPFEPALLTPELPATVGGKMLATTVEDQGIALEKLSLIASRPRQWRDGCLGITSTDELCVQVITPGWQGLVSDGDRDWVYHSDELGEQVKLNTNASDTAARIEFGPLAQIGQVDGAVLSIQVSSSLGANQPPESTTQAILIDGRIVELDADGQVQGEGRDITLGRIQAFDQQRNQAQLAQFDGLSYVAPLEGEPGSSAASFKISLVDNQGVVQYDPAIKAQLPPDLQNLDAAWEMIICSDSLADCVSAESSGEAETAE